MSKKPSRKKAPPAKRRRMAFTITVEAQPMRVSYEPRWLNSGYAHFVFRSPHNPARRIPVSDTGYLSHFATMEDVKKARSPQDFAHNLVLASLGSKQSPVRDPRQLALFR
ncbi:MAG: hypothetical protein WA268_10170 [Xanthobacteraceae bacterium]